MTKADTRQLLQVFWPDHCELVGDDQITELLNQDSSVNLVRIPHGANMPAVDSLELLTAAVILIREVYKTIREIKTRNGEVTVQEIEGKIKRTRTEGKGRKAVDARLLELIREILMRYVGD